MSALTTVAWKSFNGEFTAKIDFFDRAFYVTIADADIRRLKPLFTLFYKYLEHMMTEFEQNRMVPTIQNFVLLDKKWFINFDKVLAPFWKMFP